LCSTNSDNHWCVHQYAAETGADNLIADPILILEALRLEGTLHPFSGINCLVTVHYDTFHFLVELTLFLWLNTEFTMIKPRSF
jgi:hypothetical protein